MYTPGASCYIARCITPCNMIDQGISQGVSQCISEVYQQVYCDVSQCVSQCISEVYPVVYHGVHECIGVYCRMYQHVSQGVSLCTCRFMLYSSSCCISFPCWPPSPSPPPLNTPCWVVEARRGWGSCPSFISLRERPSASSSLKS